MQLWDSLASVSASHSVLTLGLFDGVHLGHQALLREVVGYARQHSCPSVVVTLWPHPRIVLGKEPGGFHLINGLNYKLELLEASGVDGVVVLEFTLELAHQSPLEFLQRVVGMPSCPQCIFMGYDHRFGQGGAGDFTVLRQFCKPLGIDTRQGQPLQLDGLEVSSTLVRRAIQQGDTAYAARLMGRNFSFRGTVAHGFQLGQRMGFPTANIEPYEPWQLVPGHGVYEGWCRIRTGSGGERFKAVVNVGTRPTVSSARAVSIEAHLLDFQGDLYGQELEVGFNRKLRPELKFSSVDDLKVQIAKDIECVRTGR